MSQNQEHAAFLSTIAFSPPSPNDSLTTLLSPRENNNFAESRNLGEKSLRSSQSSAITFLPSNTQSVPGRGAYRRSTQYWQNLYQSWVTDGWLLEIAALTLAALSLGVLIITLAIYHDNAVPHWRWWLTLNSLLSILSQIITLSVSMVLAGALSQQKWLWFRNSRKPLKDFGRFDEASQGPWGSFTLLCNKTRFGHFGSLGAVAMIILQAFQPFIQQVVTYPTRWEPATKNATIPRAIAFDTVDGLEANNYKQTYVSNPIKAGVYNGLYTIRASLSDVQPACSSGMCSWQSYSSLAICAYVADVSQFIQEHTYSSSNYSVSTFYTLPSGGLLAGPYENMSLVSTNSTQFASLAFRNVSTSASLSDFYTFFFSNKTGAPTLLESSLQLCAQTLNTTVNNGTTDTKELSRSVTVVENGTHNVIVPGDSTNYTMGDYSYNNLQTFLQTIFSGKYTIDADMKINYGSDAIEVLVDTLLAKPYDQEAMALFLNGFATSITNALRSGDWSDKFNGTLSVPVTYVAVSWLWLALPIIVVLLTSIFLLITILQNHLGRFEVWKSSALGPLQSLGSEARDELGGLRTISNAERRAQEIKVRLRNENGRWVLR